MTGTVIDGWEGHTVFVRASTPTRTRNAQLRRAKPPVERPASLYIVVFRVTLKGAHWSTAEHFIAPIIAENKDALSALFNIAGGFDLLFDYRPEFRDCHRWKVSAAYENARVWARKERTRRNEERCQNP